MNPTTSGAVIAGGRSGRLGTDKRFVAVDGAPLLARTVAVLLPLVDDLQVVVADPDDRASIMASLTDTLGADIAGVVRITVDARAGIGPAAGLETALHEAQGDAVLVVATDHPALAPGVLMLLLERARSSDSTAVTIDGPFGPEPFVAVYRRDALPVVRAVLDAGERRMQAVLRELGPEVVGEDVWRPLDPAGRTLTDVDTPGDLDAFR